jgi:NRAMP (natural resistance-associated macrophage protein)-like metal ion transporter
MTSAPEPSRSASRLPSTRPRRAGAREVAARRHPNPVWRAFATLGPGVVSGAADDDPAGVGTYAVAGASLGFSTLWTMLLALPMMATAQFIAAKIGIVTGMGAAEVLRRHYPRALVYSMMLALALANTVNAGADIGALAAAIHLLAPLPSAALVVPIAAFIVVLLFWGSYQLISSVFKVLALVLFAYVGAAILAHPHWTDVLGRTFVPAVRLDARFLSVLVALLGTSMSPYMWFWQASQEEEAKIAIGQRRAWQRRGASDAELGYAAWDINVGMLFSQVIAYFIILATAATLFAAGKTNITSAAEAAEALRPLAGDGARLLFALGLVGSGILGIPVLLGTAAYVLAETFGWKHGLNETLRRAPGFYAVIAASTLVGMLINFAGVNPIQALFWTSIIFGFLTPPLLALLMLVASNRRIMGDRANTPTLNVAGWTTTAITAAAAIGLVLTAGK